MIPTENVNVGIVNKEPIAIMHAVILVLSFLGTVLTNVLANVPADANWTILGVNAAFIGAASAARRYAFSPATVKSLLIRLGVSESLASQVMSGQVPISSLPESVSGQATRNPS